MPSLNRVILAGNLTRDPEVRYLASGTAVADLGLAVNETYRNKQGEDKEQTTYVDITVWGRQAETCGEYLSKGSPALIEGRLQFEQWETQQGEKRSKLKVRADRVQFLGGGSGERRRSDAFADNPPARDADAAPPPNEEDEDNLPF